MRVKNLLSIEDLGPQEILEICTLAGNRFRELSHPAFSQNRRQNLPPVEVRSAVGLIFLEASTRTRCSFERACQILGRPTLLIESKGTSVEKGESLHDTVLTLHSLDVGAFVIRTPVAGSLKELTQLGVGPILNAGDGQGEHPTQVLADLATLVEFVLGGDVSRVKGFRLGIVGDLKHSRVARSWALLAPKVGVHLKFLSPENWKPTDWKPFIVWQSERRGFLEDLDALMALRVQKERIEGLSQDNLTSFVKTYQFKDADLSPKQWLLHPGPTNWGVELDPSFLDHPRSLIRHQVRMGLAVRSVLLEALEAAPNR